MGILRSQVIVPMRLMARDPRLRITIVSGERARERDQAEEKRLGEELAGEGIALRVFEKQVGHAARHVRATPLRRALAPVLLTRDVMRLSRVVQAFTRDKSRCVVHARSHVPAWAAVRARRGHRFKLVFDPRGALPEELRDANGWGETSWRYRWWKRLESRVVREAVAVIGVSQPMADHFDAIGSVTPLVVRNCVDLDRFLPGTRVPSPDEPLRLVSLVGVDVPYQATEQSTAVRESLADLWPGGAVLRILSPDADAIRQRVGGERVTCESPPRAQIPAILAESDIHRPPHARRLGGQRRRLPSEVRRVSGRGAARRGVRGRRRVRCHSP
jgi:hypothetical protein